MKNFLVLISFLILNTSVTFADYEVLMKINYKSASVDVQEKIENTDGQPRPYSKVMEYYKAMPIKEVNAPIGVSFKKIGTESGSFIYDSAAQDFGPNYAARCSFEFNDKQDKLMILQHDQTNKQFTVKFIGKRAKQVMSVFNETANTMPFNFETKDAKFSGEIDKANNTVTFKGTYQ